MVTLHRPSNVDNRETLEALCRLLEEISRKTPLVFPVHPRTLNNIERFGFKHFFEINSGVFLLEPLSYIRFMNLVFHCAFVVTDSGGIQEETSYLGIPCLTVRENTERPITITHGTNKLCGLGDLKQETLKILGGQVQKPKKIQYWDGKTAARIVEVLGELHRKRKKHVLKGEKG